MKQRLSFLALVLILLFFSTIHALLILIDPKVLLFVFCLGCGQISRRVFELIRSEGSLILSPSHGKESVFQKTGDTATSVCANVEKVNKANSLATNDVDKSKSKPFEVYKRRATVVVSREIFVNVVCHGLAEYKYVGHDQRADLILACRLISYL